MYQKCSTKVKISFIPETVLINFSDESSIFGSKYSDLMFSSRTWIVCKEVDEQGDNVLPKKNRNYSTFYFKNKH